MIINMLEDEAERVYYFPRKINWAASSSNTWYSKYCTVDQVPAWTWTGNQEAKDVVVYHCSYTYSNEYEQQFEQEYGTE